MSGRMRRAIRDAMLRHVHVKTRAKPSRERFPLRAARNLFHAEIFGLRIFAVQQCCGDPNFVRHLEQLLGLSGHGKAPV